MDVEVGKRYVVTNRGIMELMSQVNPPDGDCTFNAAASTEDVVVPKTDVEKEASGSDLQSYYLECMKANGIDDRALGIFQWIRDAKEVEKAAYIAQMEQA